MQITIISAHREHGSSFDLIWTPIAKSIRTKGIEIVHESFPRIKHFDYHVENWRARDVAHHVGRMSRHARWQALSLTVRRDGADDVGERRGADFVRAPQDMMVVDIDGQPFEDGWDRERLISETEACVRAHLDAVIGPERVEKLNWTVVLSSSCGFAKAGKPLLRYHLYFDLDRAYPPYVIDAEIKDSQERYPFMDGSIYNLGQLLLTAAPDLDVEDPFPQRVFSHWGGHDIRLAEAADGMVALTLPASRGRSSTLYRISRDRFAAHEFVSEECYNFLISLKRQNPAMGWDHASAHLEAAMRDAGADRYHFERMSIRGDHLGDGKRMWHQIHGGGAQQVYGQPAYQEPEGSIELASEAMRRAVEGQVESEGMFLNKVTLGVGKTHEIVALAARRPDLRFLVLAPNHERCDEIRDRLDAARRDAIERLMPDNLWEEEPWEVEALSKRSWNVWRGRSAGGMCERLPAVDAAFEARVSNVSALGTSDVISQRRVSGSS